MRHLSIFISLVLGFFLFGCISDTTETETTTNTIVTTISSSEEMTSTDSSITGTQVQTTTTETTTTTEETTEEHTTTETTTTETTTVSSTTAVQTVLVTAIVDFDSCGGSAVDRIVTVSGETITLPDDPTREHYEFDGWYLEATYENAFDEATPIIYDIVLYAKWIQVDYEISYYIMTIDADTQIVLKLGESIQKIVTAGDNTMILTNQGRVFTAGYNQWGNLGDGTFQNSNQFIDITENFYLVDDYVTDVFMSEAFSIALTYEHKIFFWGHNNRGIADTGIETLINIPWNVTNELTLNQNEYVVQAAPMIGSLILLTNQGRVLSKGYNEAGQLGTGDTVDRYAYVDITANFNLAIGEVIVAIDAGREHAMALTSDNRIYTWGFNSDGQLGTGDTTLRNSPTNITANFGFEAGEQVTMMECGWYHNMVVTNQNNIFVFGYNFFGQLGTGDTLHALTPVDMSYQIGFSQGETIVSIALGASMSGIITSENKIYTWGFNTYGQLGSGTWVTSYDPINVTLNFNLEEEEELIGIIYGSNHGAVMTSERFFTLGDNGYGQLGNATYTNVNVGEEIKTAEFVFVDSFTYAFDDEIYGFDPEPFVNYNLYFWYTDEDFSTAFNLTTMPGNDLILYGYYEEIVD